MMLNFQFCFPTQVIFGAGEFAKLGDEVAKYGHRALLVEQPGPLEKNGLFARGVHLMEQTGVAVCELSGVESNPRLTKITDGQF